ncbi:hypothetical protein CTRI78_v002118 [Colletotrichum trifolii]|uniref:Uncharacterized protein n=1 Tax=Colletotrichum trifolii TaxID=5466 RepID=A0A4R8RMZ0_COLTR|nr:hypothetical protein CTRI78_v002118 [Colletotrichum trifolii]
MSGLPPGWEWDYDGARWFYRYKPNGHVQFHFPKEGDEFPDFVDALSPAPELAPEEKLESQQQLKRRTTTDADPQTKMRVAGGPLADFGMNRSGFGGPLNDDDDADGFCYQPENFMYLGPGAYIDISPSADEDEGGGIPNDRHPSKSNAAPELIKYKAKLDADVDRTGVSPLHSQANTPFVANSMPVEQPTSSGRSEPVLLVNTQDLPESNQAAVPSPGVPLLDSVEKPRAVAPQAPWDPVGIVAEMATEHTAAAHIETNPDPVEMADNAVLAPIETRVVDVGIAELPERTSPADAGPLAASDHDLLHQTSMTGAALQGATFGTGQRPQSASPERTAIGSSHPAVNGSQVDNSLPEPVRPQQQPTSHLSNGPFTIKRKPSNPGTKQPKYQPYIPGATPLVAPTRADRGADFKRQDNRTLLAREASLMLGTRQKLETENVPSILQPPQVPPKHPLDATQAAPVESYGPSQRHSTGLSAHATTAPCSQAPFQHVPSVLKPARGNPQAVFPPGTVAPGQGPVHGQDTATTAGPQSLQAGRSSQTNPVPFRYSAFQPGMSSSSAIRPTSGTNGAPRPGLYRVGTAPAQSPSDHRPPSTVSQGRGTADVPFSERPGLPAYLQRPGPLAGIRQNAPDSAVQSRARSSSDVRQYSNPAAQQTGAPVLGTNASRPHSAMDFMQGRNHPRPSGVSQQQGSSPAPGHGLPRQASFASSEVSSLGPPSGSQSSGFPIQTPSPLESGGRRHSSGFFRSADINPASGSSASPGFQTSYAAQNIPPRPAATRPASFSAPSPAVQPSVDNSLPKVPSKIPLTQLSIAPGNPAAQGLVDAAQSPPSGRRRSLPMNPDFETGGTLSSRNVQELPDTARRVERPQSAQPVQSNPANYPGQLPPPGASDLASTQPPDAGRHVKQASERPQRQTVTPPVQFFGPMTPSTPVKTPGHQLQPIQEHTEGNHAAHNMLPSVVARNSQDARRQSPATSRRLSTGSSQYPSSADSPSGRTLGSSTSAHFMSPAAPTAGQTYSPVQQNPYYQQSPTGAVAQASPLTMRPGTTPPVTQRQAKEKEKGGWLSRIVKGSGKPAVLQKPPPPAHAFHAAPQRQQPFGGDQERFSASSSGWRPTSQTQHGQVAPNEHVHQQARPDAGRLQEPPTPARLVESTPHAMEQTLVPKQTQTASAPVEQVTPRFNLQDAPVQQLAAEVQPASLPPSGLTAGLGAHADDMSDAASVSAISVSTVDVSEAQAQPVLKPQLITVEKPPVSAKEQLPSRAMMSTSAGVEKLPVTTTQREVNRRPALGSELAVAPLFSKHQIKTTVSAVAVTEAPVTSDKWAKKPAVDYSGDDWGDDPWDYQ